MKIEWKNSNLDECAAILTKDDRTVFRIMEARDHYYATYFNYRLFKSPILKYSDAAEMAKYTFGKSDIENWRQIAKNFFLEDYINQVKEIQAELKEMEVQ